MERSSRDGRRAWAFAVVVLSGWLACLGSAQSQPEPSIRTTCGELKAAIDRLPLSSQDDIVTIAVTGPLVATSTSAGIVFLVVCSPPDPQVVCAAYTDEGRRPGEPITVVGAIGPERRDRILLDPCIHFGAEK